MSMTGFPIFVHEDNRFMQYFRKLGLWVQQNSGSTGPRILAALTMNTEAIEPIVSSYGVTSVQQTGENQYTVILDHGAKDDDLFMGGKSYSILRLLDPNYATFSIIPGSREFSVIWFIGADNHAQWIPS